MKDLIRNIVIVYLFIGLGIPECFAQKSNAESQISIMAYMPEYKDLPKEASDYLVSKMKQIITKNGLGDDVLSERFVLTAKVNIESKDIVAGSPSRISQQLEVVFYIGDVVENKVYGSVSISALGIGQNETKAYITAFKTINPQSIEISELLKQSKDKIVSFYSSHCNEIMKEAIRLSSMQQYEESLAKLISIPNVCSDCYEECTKQISHTYQQMINIQGSSLLKQARAAWSKDMGKTGAEEAYRFLQNINGAATCQNDVSVLTSEIKKKLKDDELRYWNLMLKQYNDRIIHEKEISQNSRDIAIEFARNQPKTITYNSIYFW